MVGCEPKNIDNEPLDSGGGGPPPPTPTWSAVLAAGNTSGSNDASMNPGQRVIWPSGHLNLGTGAGTENGTQSIAIGTGAGPFGGDRRIAIGDSSGAGSNLDANLVSLGHGSRAGDRSAAVGDDATALNESVAFGFESIANGIESVGVGFQADCGGSRSIVMGAQTGGVAQALSAEENIVLSSLGYKNAQNSQRSVYIGTRICPTLGVGVIEDNVMVGGNSDSTNASLTKAVAVGADTSVDNNCVAVGYGSSADGEGTAVGHQASSGHALGNNNTAVGRSAGSTSLTGNLNVYVGDFARPSSVIADESVGVGSSSTVHDEGVAVGHDAHGQHADCTQVGWGTTTGATSQILLGHSVTGDATASRFAITPGIATVGVTANLRYDASGFVGPIASSMAYKKNVRPLAHEYDSSKIYDLTPVAYEMRACSCLHPRPAVTYEDTEEGRVARPVMEPVLDEEGIPLMKSDNTPKMRKKMLRPEEHCVDCPAQIGLIAEEVEKVCPRLVEHNQDGSPESVAYSMLPVLMLAEMKKLRAENDDLQSRLLVLERRLNIVRQ